MAETTRSQTTEVVYVVEFRRDENADWHFWDSYGEDELDRAETVARGFIDDSIESRVVKETVVRRTTVSREVLT